MLNQYLLYTVIVLNLILDTPILYNNICKYYLIYVLLYKQIFVISLNLKYLEVFIIL